MKLEFTVVNPGLVSKDVPVDKIVSSLADIDWVGNKDISCKAVSVVFVDSAYIQRLNKEYRGKDEPTDVLSFNIDSVDMLGEVYISEEYIRSDLEDNNREVNYLEEVCRMIIHGTLHLLGYDHESKLDWHTDKPLEKMYEIQEKHLTMVLDRIS